MQDKPGIAVAEQVEAPVAGANLPAKALEFLQRSRDHQFWTAQVVGWMGLSLVSFVSLTLWYNQPELLYILHTIAQSVLGIFISWPMRWVFRRVWEVDLVLRLSISILSALVFAAIWAALRVMF